MPTPERQAHILNLAKRGAVQRIQELRAEMAALLRMFPALRASTPSAWHAAPPAKPAASAVRSRKPMSAAARKAVSQRMKKYWAERRKARKAQKDQKAKQ